MLNLNLKTIFYKLRDLFIILSSILLGFIIIEISSYGYLKIVTNKKPLSIWEFRNSTPPPYSDKNIYSKEFLLESISSIGGYKLSEDLQHFRLSDFNGKYINIKNNIRVTSDSIKDSKNNIYLFGGSTVFGQEVWDKYTIASYLQRKLNKNSKKYNVYNYGVVSFVSSQQTSLLKTINLNKGDIIIFYDGANDIAYPLDRNRLIGSVPGGDHHPKISDTPLNKLTKFEKFISIIFFKFPNLHSIKLIYSNLIKKYKTDMGIDYQTFKRNIEIMKNNYRNSIINANKYAKNYNAEFYHFLQPTIFTVKEKSDYENLIIENNQLSGLASKESYEIGYPILEKTLNDLKKEYDIKSFNLSKVLNKRVNNEEFYLDWVHVNHKANEIVAGNIYNSIF